MNPNEKLLGELFVKYGTDKGIWGYTPYYAALMGPARHHVRRVLEVGICGHRDIPNNVVGASLFVWRDFFPNADIYGLDNDPRFVFNDQYRIRTACVDAYDADCLHAALTSFATAGTDGRFDVIIDDAVHDPEPQAQLMNQLGEWMLPGGHYFMEDVCPYKMPNGNIQEWIERRVRGFVGTAIGLTVEKPEKLVIGVK